MVASYTIDLWTALHLLGWALAGSVARRHLGLGVWAAAAAGLALGAGWEVLEASLVEPWLGFREPFWNRWGADLLVDAGGAALGAYAPSPKRSLSRNP